MKIWSESLQESHATTHAFVLFSVWKMRTSEPWSFVFIVISYLESEADIRCASRMWGVCRFSWLPKTGGVVVNILRLVSLEEHVVMYHLVCSTIADTWRWILKSFLTSLILEQWHAHIIVTSEKVSIWMGPRFGWVCGLSINFSL